MYAMKFKDWVLLNKWKSFFSVLFASGIILSIHFFIIFYEIKPTNADLYATKSLLENSTKELTKVKKSIQQAHYAMNEQVGWGSLVLSPNAPRSFSYVLIQIQSIIELTEDTEQNQELLKDLNNAVRLIEMSQTVKDVSIKIKALKYAHRIIHDLDYWGYNFEGNRNSEYWGLTNVLDDSNTVDLFLLSH